MYLSRKKAASILAEYRNGYALSKTIGGTDFSPELARGCAKEFFTGPIRDEGLYRTDAIGSVEQYAGDDRAGGRPIIIVIGYDRPA